ncbi:MAG: rod shape-determining protein RodA [Firmicutes bacterium]|nr:rod shape-determining protein RodA [Bacillota bacterium]
MWDRRLLRNLDYQLLLAVALLVAIGLVTVYSATRSNIALSYGDPFFFVKKQLASVFLGILGMAFIIFFDYRLSDLAYHLVYLVNLVLLTLVLFFGSEVSGAKAWLNFGIFSLQPAELSKLFLILTLAKFLSEKDINTFKGLGMAFLHLLPPLALILLQPDFGTAMVFVFFFFVMLFMAGLKLRYLIWILVVIVFLTGAMGIAHYAFGAPLPIKDYQINRLLVFIDPDRDPAGHGWSVRQAVIAVGSGRFFGKGLFQNTQGQLGFLPEKHTDFIFGVFCEEWGFFGAFILLGLYFFLIWRSLRIAQQAKEKYGTLIAVGIMAVFLVHVLENIGMNMRIMPVTGIPLPFISYGGSAMTINLIFVGLLESIWVRRQKILF